MKLLGGRWIIIPEELSAGREMAQVRWTLKLYGNGLHLRSRPRLLLFYACNGRISPPLHIESQSASKLTIVTNLSRSFKALIYLLYFCTLQNAIFVVYLTLNNKRR